MSILACLLHHHRDGSLLAFEDIFIPWEMISLNTGGSILKPSLIPNLTSIFIDNKDSLIADSYYVVLLRNLIEMIDDTIGLLS